MPDVGFIEINSALGRDKNLPIYKRGKYLFLRHEKLASWYLENPKHFENSEYYFKKFLENINTEFARNLFIWLCVKNKEFRNSKYAGLVNLNKRAEIFRNYIDQNPNELKSRTELSKIYQQQKKWKEAENVLLEALKIDENDATSLLELGKIRGRNRNRFKDPEIIFKKILANNPFDIPAKMQLAILYRDNNRRDEAELLYFEILKDKPSNIFALNQVSRIFKRYKKFRVSIKTAEELLFIKETDLLTVFGLINTFVITKDKKNINFYLEIGKKILSEDKNHKHREKFESLRTDFDESIELIDFYKTGHCIRENGQRFVKSEDGEQFVVPENATFNYNVNVNDKVFFGVYSKNGGTFADFVEPYFENIDDLEALK